MIQYVKRMIEQLTQRLNDQKFSEGLHSRFHMLVEELDRLDPRDFEPPTPMSSRTCGGGCGSTLRSRSASGRTSVNACKPPTGPPLAGWRRSSFSWSCLKSTAAEGDHGPS